jgi:hypothetical protein
MKKAKVNVLIALFAYSGNGGIASTIPELVVWVAKTYYRMRQDERIDQIGIQVFCDTPITMTRNQALKVAQQGGFDMVLMLDSDNEPDGYLKVDLEAKPFWEVAFELVYSRLMQGKPTIIAAPYCGPPPHPTRPGDEGEVPYLFQWMNNASDEQQPGIKLHRLNRNEAALMRGIQRVGALPTGVCLITLNACEGLEQPYFRYEMNADGTEKNSTEDVVFTRNASLLWQEKIGENVVFAACDSWALHHKTKKVGRPTILPLESVAADFREAVLANHHAGERILDLDLEPVGLDVDGETLKPVDELPYKSNGHSEKSFRYGRRKFSWTQISAAISGRDLEVIADLAKVFGQHRGDVGLRAITLGDNHALVATVLADLGNWTTYVPHGDSLAQKNSGEHFGQAVRVVVDNPLTAEQSHDCDMIVVNDSTPDLIDCMRHLSADGALIVVTKEDSPALDALLLLCDSADIEPRNADGSNVYWVTKQQYLAGLKAKHEPVNV